MADLVWDIGKNTEVDVSVYGFLWTCSKRDSPSSCDDACLNHGRYCSPSLPASTNQSHDLPGQDILKVLLTLCSTECISLCDLQRGRCITYASIRFSRKQDSWRNGGMLWRISTGIARHSQDLRENSALSKSCQTLLSKLSPVCASSDCARKRALLDSKGSGDMHPTRSLNP